MFKTPIGTFSNGSGLPQVPAGSDKIPQSLLNNVGRQIDKARIAPSQGLLMTQTAGGTSIDFAGMLAQAGASLGVRLPFQVDVIGVTPTGIQCRIAEGRVFGRVEWVQGKYYPGSPEAESFVPSLGIAGLDVNEWPTPDVPSDEAEPNPKDPGQSQTTQGSDGSQSSGVVNNTWTHYNGQSGQAGSLNPNTTKSGNAGSIIKWSNPQGWTHYNGQSGNAGSIIQLSGNQSYTHWNGQSGNAGSIMNWSAPQPYAHWNGMSGNAGSIIRPGSASGTFHTPVKPGN